MADSEEGESLAEESWCEEQRNRVADYLASQGVSHGRIGDWPAWHVVPYVSIWAVESKVRPEWIGWWVICGDLPTDYVSASDVEPPQHPRKAMQLIAERWIALTVAWKEGREFDDMRIVGSHSPEELGPLLESRARLLQDWAMDDSLWEEY